jgi:hypothetical protein
LSQAKDRCSGVRPTDDESKSFDQEDIAASSTAISCLVGPLKPWPMEVSGNDFSCVAQDP